MFTPESLRQKYVLRPMSEFVTGLLILNALYWQQCDEMCREGLDDNYTTPLRLKDCEIFRMFGIEVESISHFDLLNNTQRINVWYDAYINHRLRRAFPCTNCLKDSSFFSLLAILMVTVENELKGGDSVNAKVDKFSRRIAIWSQELISQLHYKHIHCGVLVEDFPLTFDELCLLVPLDFDGRDEFIEDMRGYERDYITHCFQHDKPFDICDAKSIQELRTKYGEDYFRAAYSVDTKSIERWGKLFYHFESAREGRFMSVNRNDMNAPLVVLKACVGLMNIDAKDKFDEENYEPNYPDSDQPEYEPVPVEFFYIKDYIASMLPREQVLQRLVQVVLLRLYAGESFKNDDVVKLDDIPTPMKLTGGVQSALSTAAYRCGHFFGQHQSTPCLVSKEAIDELFPSLDTFFQRGMSGGQQ